MASTMPGTPPPEPRSSARRGASAVQQGQHAQRVEQVKASHLGGRDDAGQVDPCVRLEQKLDVPFGGIGEAGGRRRPQGGRIGLEQILERAASRDGVGQRRCSSGWPFGLPHG